MYKLKNYISSEKINFEYFEHGTTFSVFFSQDLNYHIISLMSMSKAKHEQA